MPRPLRWAGGPPCGIRAHGSTPRHGFVEVLGGVASISRFQFREVAPSCRGKTKPRTGDKSLSAGRSSMSVVRSTFVPSAIGSSVVLMAPRGGRAARVTTAWRGGSNSVTVIVNRVSKPSTIKRPGRGPTHQQAARTTARGVEQVDHERPNLVGRAVDHDALLELHRSTPVTVPRRPEVAPRATVSGSEMTRAAVA
jgi:hypothetical protein